jgi:hypothetical protein
MRGANDGEVNSRTEETLLRAEQGLEVERRQERDRFRTGSDGRNNGKGATLPDEGRWLHGGRSPLDGRILNVAVGWNKPASR